MSKKQGNGPFDLLLEELTKTTHTSASEQTSTSSRLSFKFNSLLKSNNKRKEIRINATGFVALYDETGKAIARGVLRNASSGGFGIESFPINLTTHQNVYVEISGLGESLGKFKCKVSWITNIENHPDNYKMIGFDISSNTQEFKNKFQKFVNTLTTPQKVRAR